jgi:uncharacterized DUF497 family protein
MSGASLAAGKPNQPMLLLLVAPTVTRYGLGVQYEWDDGKAVMNFRKHGVDFTDAIAALEDPNRTEEIDARFEYGEEPARGHRNGSRQGASCYGDIARRGHLQNHIGPEGHTT